MKSCFFHLELIELTSTFMTSSPEKKHNFEISEMIRSLAATWLYRQRWTESFEKHRWRNWMTVFWVGETWNWPDVSLQQIDMNHMIIIWINSSRPGLMTRENEEDVSGRNDFAMSTQSPVSLHNPRYYRQYASFFRFYVLLVCSIFTDYIFFQIVEPSILLWPVSVLLQASVM